MRLLRGTSLEHLAGIQPVSIVRGLFIARPLLEVPAIHLRDYLRSLGHDWREDLSNQSAKYERNRCRRWLANQSPLRDALIKLAKQSDALRRWLDLAAPVLEGRFASAQLRDIPAPLARQAASRWLVERGSPRVKINAHATERLMHMATDAASPAQVSFPGGFQVRRKQGMIFVERSADFSGD